MFRFIISLSLLFIVNANAQIKIEESQDIRILNLLPFEAYPPLIEPCLPQEFILGERDDDPYFSKGYFWGSKGVLNDYFSDPSHLNDCLIHVQQSSKVLQLALDRFSIDENTHDLVMDRFGEIQVKKGKWNIFPYREIQSKDSKGRINYEVWVGLNNKEGKALLFKFIYPKYLKEPTQNQKKVWDNFIHKTKLLCMKDLLIARNMIKEKYAPICSIQDRVNIIVEKRRFDQKLLIYIDSLKNIKTNVHIQNVQDMGFFNGKSLVEMESCIQKNNGGIIREKIKVYYNLVDQFTFHSKMLVNNRFKEHPKYLLFQ